MAVEVFLSIVFGFVGLFIGVAGWLSGREKKVSDDAHWKGTVDENLKSIQDGIRTISNNHYQTELKVDDHETRISVIESKINIKKEG